MEGEVTLFPARITSFKFILDSIWYLFPGRVWGSCMPGEEDERVQEVGAAGENLDGCGLDSPGTPRSVPAAHAYESAIEYPMCFKFSYFYDISLQHSSRANLAQCSMANEKVRDEGIQ